MSSKLGIHVQRIVGGVEDFIKEAKPGVVKSLEHNPDFWREVKEASPDTFIVGRLYVEKQLLDDPIRRAREFCDELFPVAERMRGIYDAWEGYNEITCFDAETMRRYVDFEVERARIMHEEGFEVVVGNFSTGHPDLDMWEHFLPALREGDFLGLHEYDAPTMRRWETWLCLRYRRIYDRLPQDARPPLIITECGIDGGVIPGHGLEGWKKFVSEEEYLSQLKWYDGELQKDDYVIGATIFLFGCYPQWESFDIAGEMADKLSAYIQSTQVAPPPPKPWKKLEDYPRSANGSWRGMHGSAECHHRWATELEGKRRWLPIIKDLKIGWYKVLDDGSCDSIPLIKLLLAEGMKPIMRLYRGSPFPPPLKPKEAEAIRRLVEAGAIYFEVVNEPQFGDKPRGLETIVDNFIHNADLIHEAGGIPLFPSIGINHLEEAFKMVAAKGRRDILEEGAAVA
ncbi:MAG: hypothetical protein U9R11_01815, partial [Chloroflexota bacterium]|nr:hypothetical protein [Chloroflexota bacterium]